jgi:hypothetical protein
MHLLLLVVVLIVTVVGLAYLVGFRIGSESNAAELQRIKLEAVRAQREIHNLVAAGFAALADEVVRRRR